jgi:hypothetical protein
MNNYTKEEQLAIIYKVAVEETKEDNRLYNMFDKGEITMEEYKAQSPRYNSQIHVIASKIGLEL